MAIRILNTNYVTVSVNNLEEGLEKIKELAAGGTPENKVAVELILDADRYHLSSPLLLSVEKDPVLANVKLTIKGKDGMTPKISGAWYFYHDKFEAVKGKPYYKYQLDKKEDGTYPQLRDMMIDRQRISIAKSETYLYPFSARNRDEKDEETFLRGLFAPIEMAKKLAKDKTTSAELQVLLEWEHKIFRIEGVDLETTRECGGKKYALLELADEYREFVKENRFKLLDIQNRRFFISNALSFIGEDTFVYDYKQGTAYYYPGKNIDIVHHTQEYCRLENLFIIEGMEDLTLENLVFVGTTAAHVCQNGYMAGQANAVRKQDNGVYFRHLPAAAVYTRNMRNFKVKNCSFTGLGGNGILMNDKSVGVFIEHCCFENIAMSAAVIGNPDNKLDAWDNPLNRNIGIHFNYNRVRRVALDYPAACGFYVALVDGIEFTHNTLIELGYSAFSAGWNWNQVNYTYGEKVNVRAAEIAYNYFEDYMLVLEDGGAVYVNGGNCSPDCAKRFNKIHDNYAICREKRARATYGYYMDGAASNWDCYHNVILNVNQPIYAQPYPTSLSCHVHIRDTYANTRYNKYFDVVQHEKARDVVVENYHLLEDASEEALLAAYPEALAIRKAAGIGD